MDPSAARLKRFEQWKKDARNAGHQEFVQAYRIRDDTDQDNLRRELASAAKESMDLQDVIAATRLPFKGTFPRWGADFTTLYVAKNMFELDRDSVVWMLDGSIEPRCIQCSGGNLDELLFRMKSLRLVEKLVMSDNQCRLFYKRVEDWYLRQIESGGLAVRAPS